MIVFISISNPLTSILIYSSMNFKNVNIYIYIYIYIYIGCDYPIPGQESSGSKFCYVRFPNKCKKATKSLIFKGAAFRDCE